MSNRILFAVLLCCSLVSCGQISYEEPPEITFSITSPKENWTYYDDTKIMLAVNVNTQAITWTSNIHGKLGEGNHVSIFMPEGVHRITAEIQGVPRTKEIAVYARSYGHSRKILINYTPLEFKVKTGTSYPYLFTHNGTVNELTIPKNSGSLNRYSTRQTSGGAEEAGPRRDIRLTAPPLNPALLAGPKSMPDTRLHGIAAYDTALTGTKRVFNVVNTQNQTGRPHEIEAVLHRQSGALTIWLPENVKVSAAILDDLILKTETRIMPRVEKIWGKPADIDGDGRLALLFAPTINQEQLATGFFNPADFFRRDANPQSKNYNPASNEMDILYVAVPESGGNASYSAESIAATIAHELTHAVTFTAKTWKRLKTGNEQAVREELFLDEGWSHVTENLCGYGVSGGNIAFMNRFFDNTALYSFCGANRLGQEDSAGMRGAITLLLSWLFWKAGGMDWDRANPVTLRDTGGISFLRRMAESPQTGWESIGAAFGKPTETLFTEMLDEINNYRAANNYYQYRTDPLTGEAVDFFVNMGLVTSPQNPGGVMVGFPGSANTVTGTALGSWSFVLLEPFAVMAETLNTIQAKHCNGSAYLAVSH